MSRINFVSGKHLMWIFFILGICSLSPTNKTYSQPTVYTLHADSLQKNMELSFVFADWYFHPGDLSQPVVNTQGWDTLKCTVFGNRNFPKGWNGMGWFGLWVKADAKAVNQKMCLRINHDGASEIFLDGKPIGGFGKVGFSAKGMKPLRMPHSLLAFWLNDTLPHLLAIRYSNFIGTYPDFYGFEIFLGDYDQMAHLIHRNTVLKYILLISTGAFCMLAILHFILFLYYPSKKVNLYFSAFVLVLGMIPLCIFIHNETVSPEMQYNIDSISKEFEILLIWFGGLLLYTINYGTVPLWRKRLLAVICIVYMLRYLTAYFYYEASNFYDYYEWVFVLFFCDVLWGTLRSVRKGQPGAWLIGSAMLTVALLCLFTWMDIFRIWTSRQNSWRVFTLCVGEMIFPICVSVYLALDFARTNKNLADKLKEVESLSEKALAQEIEKRELLADEAKRLEETVRERTGELRRQTEKLKETDAVKSRFFTNITHEFKTPLTLINNPAEQLLSSEDTEIQYHAQLIKKNAEKLLQLINQLLDLSKLENGLMEINNSTIELISLIQELMQTYQPLAKQKEIQFLFDTNITELWLMSDKDKLEKIFGNLLSNAVKFTHSGKVEIILKEQVETFTVTMRDTGIGIPAEKLPYIFERFYQADPTDVRFAEGTGIGLALTKELAGLLNGSIDVESKEGIYTEFNVTLPLIHAAPQSNGIATDALQKVAINDIPPNGNAVQENNADEKASVLIIEDNDALREFIGGSLAKHFHVISAPEGAEGIRLAKESVPDIVITDIMMPGTDGYEVCAKLKSDEITSHIPVIMLTAKAGVQNRIQGIKTGADAYLEKPFVHRELEALMDNLMKTRRMLQEKYQKNFAGNNTKSNMPSLEQRFLDRVQSVVHNHLDDESFGADQLAAAIGLSRTQLHRKLKGLLDKSPGDFVRTVRLEHAYYLLKQKAATVSEVAYMVGFSNPASFSASFSRRFGFPPSEAARHEML